MYNWSNLDLNYLLLVVGKHNYLILFLLQTLWRFTCLSFHLSRHFHYFFIILLNTEIFLFSNYVLLLIKAEERFRWRRIHHRKLWESKRRHGKNRRSIDFLLWIEGIAFWRKTHHRIDKRRWWVRRSEGKHKRINRVLTGHLFFFHNNCIISKSHSI
jgi:hypothetical protein